jgi:hypothetical protein
MKELLDLSLMGFNLPSTLLLMFITLYWLSVVIGMLDLDFLDIEIDLDSDVNLTFAESLLSFANIGRIPVMIILSVVALFLWCGSILFNAVLNPFNSSLLGVGILILMFIGSVLLTKIITLPLVNIFDKLNKEAKIIDFVGRVCTINLSVKNDNMGQGEIEINSNSILVNIKSWKQENILKGEKAIIIEKDDSGDFYHVEKYNEI